MPVSAPYKDSEGNEYFNVRQAARIVEGVTERTMWNWADAQKTSFGFPLTVRIEPVLHHRTPKTTEAPPKHPKQQRMVILAADVYRLKDILQDAGRTKPGLWCLEVMGRLEAAANRPRSTALTSHRKPVL
jgi:hypothetical protein